MGNLLCFEFIFDSTIKIIESTKMYFGEFMFYALIIGGIIGYTKFLTYLESKKMGNIIFRDGKFTPYNVARYMIHPLKSWHLWHPSLWRANWICMTSLGISVGFIVGYSLENISLRFLSTLYNELEWNLLS
jgi:hypothetical protein